jgi:PAS domain S-box-containing protein
MITDRTERDDSPRLRQLAATGMLDVPRDAVFDSLTRLAAAALQVPGALVTLVDRDRQWFTSAYGLGEPWRTMRESPLSHSFCRHVVERGATLAIADARRDPLVRDNPAIEAMGVVAYAGAPLVVDGHVLGAVAAFSPTAREWSDRDVALLREFAELAAAELRHRIEGATRQHAAAQQEAVLAHIPSAVVGIEAETGRVVHWNALAERLWGPRPATLDALPSLATLIGQPSSRTDHHLTTPSGEARVIRATTMPVRAADGRQLGAVLIADDVTDEVDAARRLREEEERLRAINASSPVGIFESDLDGRVTFANPRLLQIWGVTDEEIRGPGWMARVHPDDLPALIQTWRIALAARTEYEREYRLRLDDGTIRWVHGRSAPLSDSQGNVVGSVGTIEDVTERRNGMEQLLQAQKMEAVGRLAGGIAHDFNNLLTAINADAEFLIAALPADSQERGDAEDILAAAQRAAELTRQLLAFSRRQLLRLRVVDANTVVRGVEKLLRRVIGEDVRVVITLDPAVGRIRVDPGQLEQVLVNLAVNARDAMPEGGTLTISTHAAPHAARLTVSDTGHGMDDATRRRAFEPFFTTKGVDRGTGLGLATVHGVVVQSGGTIEIESEPNAGTQVHVVFPTTDQPVSVDRQVGAAAARGGSGTVLLVEDEALVRAALRRVLAEAGYAVVEAPNGRIAVELWSSERRAGARFDAVVTDLVMPEVDGAALARRLRSDERDVPILFLTGHTDRPLPADLLTDSVAPDAARTSLLQKPFSGEELAVALAAILPTEARAP